jgi:hypothetical protein
MRQIDPPIPLGTPASGARIVLRAVEATRWNGIAFTSPWGEDIAVSNGPDARLIEFSVATEAGAYELWIEFASDESRPMQIVLDGVPIMRAGTSRATGGWYPRDQAWHRQTCVPTAPTFLYPAAPAKTETGAARHSVYRAGDTLSVNAARRAAAHAGITSALAYLRIEPWPEGK